MSIKQQQTAFRDLLNNYSRALEREKRLRAENAKLRAALEGIANNDADRWAGQAALAALEETK